MVHLTVSVYLQLLYTKTLCLVAYLCADGTTHANRTPCYLIAPSWSVGKSNAPTQYDA